MKNRLYSLVVLCGLVALLSGCERPPIESKQLGFRGTAMADIKNPRTEATLVNLNKVPPSTGLAPAEGDKAGKVYQNVQVLNNLSVAQFTTFMVSMSSWVAPAEGCTYCHNPANFAEDSKYTKIVARKMIQMTQGINTGWQSHVKETGVTCYTCHRGNHIPQNVWFKSPEQAGGHMLGNLNGQNDPRESTAYSSMPNEPFSKYILENNPARIQGQTGLPTGNKKTIQETETVYSFMNHLSKSLGVNCTYCHNSRAFRDWDQSRPQRALAWHAIQMLKDVNNDYMLPLTSTFPQARLGPTGDVAKANCATCHQGVNKPLYGVSMLGDYPYLTGPKKEQAVIAASSKSSSMAMK